MKTIKQSFLTIAIGLALVAGISYAWTGPTANPPLNNAPAPVNVSATGQYKTGALGIGGLFRAYSNAIVDGNVGIGTDAPKNRLHVKGSNWPAMFVDSTDAKGGFIGYGNNSKTGWATGMEPDGTWRLESYNDNGDWREAWSNGWVTGTNVITANKNGNVGIGTVAPSAALHVKAGNGDSDPWAFRMEQGTPSAGKVLTSVDNLGNAEWRTGGGGGGKNVIVVKERVDSSSSVNCPAGYLRTGCSGQPMAISSMDWHFPYVPVYPNSQNGCSGDATTDNGGRYYVYVYTTCLSN